MRILLVHQNFPGQFLHLAPALKARGHEVLALTAESNRREMPVPGARYRWDPASDDARGAGDSFRRAVLRGTRAAKAAVVLRDKHGFVPDVIFGHCGWGETLFLREVWPRARMLAYAELMYRTTGMDTDFDPEFRKPGLEARIATSVRRAHMLQAMIDADAAVAPTQWQASTFPAELRAKIRVIHDGVDCAALAPRRDASLTLAGTETADGAPLVLRPGDEVVSFVNRRLEPYRGFHSFMRALPGVLAARPAARVVIVGEDGGQGYGSPPADGRSWKRVMLDELEGRLDLSRVHFLGRVPYARYLALLHVARVHVYLTYPFVLSWSLVEAMAAGVPILASRTPPVEEVIRDGIEGRLVDFFDIPGWSRAITAALADPAAGGAMAAAAQARARREFDLREICLPRMVEFVETAGG